MIIFCRKFPPPDCKGGLSFGTKSLILRMLS
jgi:hypothetical protein